MGRNRKRQNKRNVLNLDFSFKLPSILKMIRNVANPPTVATDSYVMSDNG